MVRANDMNRSHVEGRLFIEPDAVTTQTKTQHGKTYYLIKKWRAVCDVCGWKSLAWPNEHGARQLAREHKCT